jgi:hypothetical protein
MRALVWVREKINIMKFPVSPFHLRVEFFNVSFQLKCNHWSLVDKECIFDSQAGKNEKKKLDTDGEKGKSYFQ